MKNKKASFILLTVFLFAIHACEQERITYYEEVNPEKSIYEYLKDDGNFTHYVKALDITELNILLDNTGSFTVFPPTDMAFEKYLKQNSLAFESLSKEDLKKIVEYSLTDFALPFRYLTTKSEWGYWAKGDNSAFKKKTRYRLPNYEEDGYKIVSEAKYLPVFTYNYFKTAGGVGKEAETYNYFYPETTWDANKLGVNVAGVNVSKIEIPARNGFIYPVEKVLVPPPNIANVLFSLPEYSSFASLFDRFKEYVLSKDETEAQQSDIDLYYKKYIGNKPRELNTPAMELEVDINEENVRGGYTMQAPTYSSHTIFVPSNDAMQAHLNKYTGAPSRPALRHLLNAHLIKELIQYPYHLTIKGSPYKYLFDDNKITDAQMASNGAIYYVNEVVESNVFKSVVAPIFFNENYSTLMYALEKANQTQQLSDGTSIYHLFVTDNAYFKKEGITYEPSTDTFYKDGKVWAASEDPTATSKEYVEGFVSKLIVKGKLKGDYGKAATGEYILFDEENKRIISDNQIIEYEKSYTSEDKTGKGYMLDELFLPQEQYADYLKKAYPKFNNLLSLTGILIYDDYSLFVLPDSEITYGEAPFDMLESDGKLKKNDPNATQKLILLVNSYIVSEPLFTTDVEAYATYSARNETVSITFNQNEVIDNKGNHIEITKPNTTKLGVIIHEINSIINK